MLLEAFMKAINLDDPTVLPTGHRYLQFLNSFRKDDQTLTVWDSTVDSDMTACHQCARLFKGRSSKSENWAGKNAQINIIEGMNEDLGRDICSKVNH